MFGIGLGIGFEIYGTVNSNAAPVATDVSFSGITEIGEALNGSYTYSDAESDPEEGTTFKWYRADDSDGTNAVEIDGATESTYTLQVADFGKYICFEVTPVAETGTTTGNPVQSDFGGPITFPFDSDVDAFLTETGITDEIMINAHKSFVYSLKNQSIWSKIWDFLPIVGGDSAKHAVYGKDPTRTQVSWVGSPSHSDDGVSGNGSSQYGNLNWNPVTEGADVSNFGLGIYRTGSTENLTAARCITGSQDASSANVTNLVLSTVGTIQGRIAANPTQHDGTFSLSNGFVFVNTKADRKKRLWMNGSKVTESTIDASGSFSNRSLFLLSQNINGTPNQYCTAATIITFWIATKGLTDSEIVILNNLVEDYQSALGRQA